MHRPKKGGRFSFPTPPTSTLIHRPTSSGKLEAKPRVSKNSQPFRFNYLGIRLPTTGEVTFIKCTMEYEGYAGGFTLGNSIFLSSPILQILVDQSHGKRTYSLVYEEFMQSLYTPCLIIHELFHCISRNDASFRQRLYSLIGFTVMDHEVEFGPTVRNRIYTNPDAERFDHWAEFTIGGEKRRCILVGVYESSYAEFLYRSMTRTR